MNVYLAYPDRCDYDQFDGLVIVARDKERALEMVKDGYYNGYFENDQGEIYVEEIDLTEEHIVLESFNAG